MATVVELNRQFAIAGTLSFVEGRGARPLAVVNNQHATATVSLYGAQALSWQPHGAEPVLWVSEKARYDVGSAVRGGVPIAFPWFSGHPTDKTLPAHGFVRKMLWEMRGATASADGSTVLRMGLTHTKATYSLWPYRFDVEAEITIGRTLTVALHVTNTDSVPFTWGGTLHTYFAVGHIRNVAVSGLHDVGYLDAVAGTEHVQKGAIRFSAETDRVYRNTTGACIIHDHVLKRQVLVEKSNSRTTVVWNPDVAATKSDMTADGYTQFVCIEPTLTENDRRTLAPAEKAMLSTTITVLR